MPLKNKLIHLIRMVTSDTYRQDQERRARFARIMAANKSIMVGGRQMSINPFYDDDGTAFTADEKPLLRPFRARRGKGGIRRRCVIIVRGQCKHADLRAEIAE